MLREVMLKAKFYIKLGGKCTARILGRLDRKIVGVLSRGSTYEPVGMDVRDVEGGEALLRQAMQIDEQNFARYRKTARELTILKWYERGRDAAGVAVRRIARRVTG